MSATTEGKTEMDVDATPSSTDVSKSSDPISFQGTQNSP
jgi:hypothetical protein